MIFDLMEEVADTLRAESYFNDITVITEDVKDIEKEITVALGKIGICCVIITPKAGGVKHGVKPVYFGAVDFVVSVFELTAVNRYGTGSKKKALDVAEMVVATLHAHRPEGIAESIHVQEPAIQLVADRKLLIYDTRFGTMGGLNYAVPQVAAPVVTQDGGNATITCATPGAVLVYSTDGVTYPSPRNANGETPTAYFYTAPFATAGASSIKVRAWLPGYRQSALVTAAVA